MRLQHILETVYGRPHYITVNGFNAIDAVVRSHLRGEKPAPVVINGQSQQEPGTGLFGQKLAPVLEMDGELAQLNINGTLMQHASLLDKSCGAVSYQDISAALDEAVAEGAQSFLLNFNSPGGDIVGCLELGMKIQEMAEQFELVAFTDTMMASAAYLLAAGCGTIYTTRTAFVGSIGSMMGFIDVSKAYEMEGMKAVIFASGKLKATAAEGTTLTDDQANYMQGLVDEAAEEFKAHVQNCRGGEIADDTMEGQVFFGAKAADCRLADGLCESLEDCIGEMGY
jgi:signal peptide peptidase SppA